MAAKQLGGGSLGSVGSWSVSEDAGALSGSLGLTLPLSIGSLSVSANLSLAALVDAGIAALPADSLVGKIAAVAKGPIDALIAGL